MTGFNVNCKDCRYCYLHYANNGIWVYFCGVFGETVGIRNNIDCAEYEPKRADN